MYTIRFFDIVTSRLCVTSGYFGLILLKWSSNHPLTNMPPATSKPTTLRIAVERGFIFLYRLNILDIRASYIRGVVFVEGDLASLFLSFSEGL